MSNLLPLINQIFEIQQRLQQDDALDKYQRNFQKIEDLLMDDGYKVINPLGEAYTEMRTDLEASIIGSSSKPKISKVIKPVIFQEMEGSLKLVQKGIVIAE